MNETTRPPTKQALACDELDVINREVVEELSGQFGLRKGMSITIQGVHGRLKSFKVIPASESVSGWRELNITMEVKP